jgi:hypothetical protein
VNATLEIENHMKRSIELVMNLRGYVTTPSGEISDSEINAKGWLVVRGICIDSIFLNDAQGRRAIKSRR